MGLRINVVAEGVQEGGRVVEDVGVDENLEAGDEAEGVEWEESE